MCRRRVAASCTIPDGLYGEGWLMKVLLAVAGGALGLLVVGCASFADVAAGSRREAVLEKLGAPTERSRSRAASVSYTAAALKGERRGCSSLTRPGTW